MKSMLQLLAGFSVVKSSNPVKLIRKHTEDYIDRNFSGKLVHEMLAEFDGFVKESRNWVDKELYLENVCKEINREFTVNHKFLLLINIYNFFASPAKENIHTTTPTDDILDRVAHWLKLNWDDFVNFKYFSGGQLHRIPQKRNLLIISSHNPGFSDIQFLKNGGINGILLCLNIPSANILTFNYNGTSSLVLNGKPIFTKHNYIFSNDLILSGKGVTPIYYWQLIRTLLNQNEAERINVTALNVSFSYNKNDKGIDNLSFSAISGELIGIMGGSGVGKSTLIKLLSGNLTPNHGEILINGHNINSIEKSLSDIVGVMHQEECLVEELTVYENLFLSTRLVLGELTTSELKTIVENKLHELDLFDCRNNRVGSPLNRQLSGGQRKRLAIAMEIVRDPKILLVDEPTSGLSSADSNTVVNILKNIAREGKLVIANIHQPSSEIYKLFDRVIILDKGGIPIFIGNPLEAILHFKGIANLIDKNQSGCEYCGNTKPELIFELIEECYVNELGQKTSKRKTSSLEWGEHFQSNNSDQVIPPVASPVSRIEHNLASSFVQFKTFFTRNFISKIRNTEFIFLALLLPPILAILISVFLRYSVPIGQGSEEYNLFTNPNLASFFLMCILASLFFGLILSCEDIFRDRQLIIREKSIGLSIRCFYNAKILFLILTSAYQTMFFALLGSYIIELRGISVQLWLLLFSISLFGNLTGLIVSSTLKSIVSIYILVPFLLIPQILFSGLVVNFDNLNPRLSSETKVPLAGELMASRWATEAIITYFYVNNKFNKPFYLLDFQESELRFKLLNLLPDIQHIINTTNPDSLNSSTRLQVENGISLLVKDIKQPLPKTILRDSSIQLNFDELTFYLSSAKDVLSNRYSKVKFSKDRMVQSLYPNTPKGRQNQIATRNKYHNRSIEHLTRNRFYPKIFVISNNCYVQKSDPIFQISDSPNGRSHFFAPYKHIGKYLLETYWYNLLIIWLMIVACYIFIVLNIFQLLDKYHYYIRKKHKTVNG
jgi:ABC-type multidrug transport system ATPase subunit